MKFRTEVACKPILKKIGHKNAVLMMGSCFTDNIGSILQKYLFHADVNPFGVSYNPSSIARSLELLIEKENYKEEDLQFENELWFSFDHYTKFSDPDKAQALANINGRFLKAKKELKEASHLILTFGTAYTYQLLNEERTVNNCHKLPASNFSRKMLSIAEIEAKFLEIIERLNGINPDLQIILTVSPVRHAKDGFIDNQRSKATLLLAIEKIISSNPGNCSYFPSYEIMMDELRDYRFYEDDLLHPNLQATTYIWEKFIDACVDQNSLDIMKKLEPLISGLQHKPLHRNTKSYENFHKGLQNKLESLKENYPYLNWPSLIEK